MLRCRFCEEIIDSYEDWLTHLISEQHQANVGVSNELKNFGNDDRDERSVIMTKMNPNTNPYEVLCHFAQNQPLGFITDAYVHVFQHSNEKFYQIIFDQRKFVDRIVSSYERFGDQRVAGSVVRCRPKTSFTKKEWTSKLESSFFFRRHLYLRRQFADMNWDQQLTKLLPLISLDSKGYDDREAILEELEGILHVECEEFQKGKMRAFGSCNTWLADVNADLDIYFDAEGDQGRSDLEQARKYEILSKVEDIFRDRFGESNVYSIRNTRVPIVVLSHPSGTKVDVSFENCLSVQNSAMIRVMIKIDYRVRPFLIFLRYWARYHNLVGSQSIKSYALILMAFVFLRKKKILPSVHELQNIPGTRQFMVSNWNAGYCKDRDLVQQHLPWLKCSRESPSSDGMGHEIMRLCYEFFNEYLALDLQSMVVCPLIGSFLPKEKFESQYGVELPNEMELLKANLVTGYCFSFKTHRPLCVQDPFSLDVNVTASCANPDIIYQFKAACSQAAEALKPFIKTYGLADRECFLDLCCQPISAAKKEEIIQGTINAHLASESGSENHDNMAYVKTEATTTTNEDAEYEASFLSAAGQWKDHDDDPPADVKNEVEDALAGIRDVYREKYGCDYEEFHNKKRARSPSTTTTSSTATATTSDFRRGNSSVPIKRVSAYDSDGWGTGTDNVSSLLRKSNGLVDYNYDGEMSDSTSTDISATNKKPIKSIVVKPSTSRGGEPSSSSSSSSSGREKARKSVSPSTGPAKKRNRQEDKANSKEEESGHKRKYSDIVITVNNTQPKVPVEPVVKFVHSAAPAPQIPTISPTVKKEKDDKIDDAQIDELEEFYKSLKEDIPLSPTVVTNPLQDFNYGYKASSPVAMPSSAKSVEQPKKIKTEKTSDPTQSKPKETISKTPEDSDSSVYLTASGEESPQESIPPYSIFPDLPKDLLEPVSRFPDFAVYMDRTYQEHFLTFYSPLLEGGKASQVWKTMMLSKMKFIWSSTITAFFQESCFWQTFQIVLAPASLEIYALEIAEDINNIFCKIGQERHRFEDRRTVVQIEEVEICDYPPTLAPQMNKPSWCSEGYNLDSNALSFLSTKLGKIQLRFRNKKLATAYCFDCHHEVLMSLYRKWMKVRDLITNMYTSNKGPVDVFGMYCAMILDEMKSVPLSDPVKIKMLIAHDVSEDLPGVYVGFQTSDQDCDPTYEKQVTVQRIIKEILEDLLPRHAIFKLHKSLQK